jgi:hypothetical protein
VHHAAGPAGQPCDHLLRWLGQYGAAAVTETVDASSLQAVQGIPEAIFVSGTALHASAYLWQDFMPGPFTPPDGHPLIACVRVSAVATAPLPAMRAGRVAVIHGVQAWIAPVAEQAMEMSWNPPCLNVIVREGPKWGPGARVDVVLQLRDAEGHGHLIRVPDAEIQRTS